MRIASMKTESIERVCVFCGSSLGRGDKYEAAAVDLARALASRGIDMVYGGGRVGLMGVIADEMLRQRRKVIGVIPRSLADREVAHTGLDDLRVVRTMHERKSLMTELSDAFVALPGGFGTLEELFEIVTWAQLGIHQKPIGILNVGGFFDPVLATIAKCIKEDFIRPEYYRLIESADDADLLLDCLERFQPLEGVTKWIDLVET